MRGDIEMALIENLEFRVTENNGGGIALAIKEDDHFIYIHSGYENIEGQLIEDIKALFGGQHPSEWDGCKFEEFKNSLEADGFNGDSVAYMMECEFWDGEQGVNVIMSTDTVSLSMFTGLAGRDILKNALGIDDVEEWLESHDDDMPMTDFLSLCK